MNLSRLEKVWALAGSANKGEAAAARNLARRIVEAEGKTLADVPTLLWPKAAPAAPPSAGFNPFAGFDDRMEREQPGWKAKRAREAAERRQKEKDEREELLNRYGSEEAILARTPIETALLEAVRPWVVWQQPPYDPRWVESIDGCQARYSLDGVTQRVKDAIAGAHPLPTTISGALDEFLMWKRRDDECCLAVENTDDTQLDLPAQFRQEMVRRLLEIEIRASSISDVLIRQRFYVDQASYNADIERAVLLDLEALTAHETQYKPKTASAPRRKARQGDMFSEDQQ